MKYLFFLILFLMSLACCATIYMQIDKNGQTIFSDIPQGNNPKVVVLPEINQLITTKSVNPASSSGAPSVNQQLMQNVEINTQEVVRKPYVNFVIASPKDQESIQNQPSLAVDMNVSPALQAGDNIQIYLDGSAWGSASNRTHFDFTIPYRGTHTLSAKLMDSNRRVLMQTPTITIYVHQAHIPTSPPAPNIGI